MKALVNPVYVIFMDFVAQIKKQPEVAQAFSIFRAIIPQRYIDIARDKAISM
ncbi:hypothetical protein ACBZ91_18575 [Vibrio natriegens]|uniref:hypothetical protein n=1 Tax=Vibrio natriegens TaxID=691 RepID=UPI003557471F